MRILKESKLILNVTFMINLLKAEFVNLLECLKILNRNILVHSSLEMCFVLMNLLLFTVLEGLYQVVLSFSMI